MERQAAMCGCHLPSEVRPGPSTVGDWFPFVFEASGSKIRYMTGRNKRPQARPPFIVPKFNASEVVGNRMHRGGASPSFRPKDGDV